MTDKKDVVDVKEEGDDKDDDDDDDDNEEEDGKNSNVNKSVACYHLKKILSKTFKGEMEAREQEGNKGGFHCFHFTFMGGGGEFSVHYRESLQ